MAIKNYFKTLIANSLQVSESELSNLNLLTLQTNFPEVNKNIQRTRNKQNIMLLKLFLIFLVPHTLYIIIEFNIRPKDNDLMLATVCVINSLAFSLITVIFARGRFEFIVHYHFFIIIIFELCATTLSIYGFLPYT